MSPHLNDKPKKCSETKAPANYGEMFNISIDDMRLEEVGQLYYKTLSEAVDWLRYNGFNLTDHGISGTWEGKPVIVLIWNKGFAMSELPIFRVWDKSTVKPRRG